jgi:hypothetical protein
MTYGKLAPYGTNSLNMPSRMTKIELLLILPSGTTPLNRPDGICADRHEFVLYSKLVPYGTSKKVLFRVNRPLS